MQRLAVGKQRDMHIRSGELQEKHADFFSVIYVQQGSRTSKNRDSSGCNVPKAASTATAPSAATQAPAGPDIAMQNTGPASLLCLQPSRKSGNVLDRLNLSQRASAPTAAARHNCARAHHQGKFTAHSAASTARSDD